MKTLDQIGTERGTDKSSILHDYLRRYEPLFAAKRKEPIDLLEMGVLGGQSLDTWAEYFTNPDAMFTGMDIHDWGWKPFDNRQVFILGSQTDADLASNIGQKDIIIDDAGHFASQQMAAFSLYWPKVKPGGIYLLEDTHVIYSAQHCDAPLSILEFFHRITEQMQDRAGATGSGKVQPTDPWHDIESISFSKGFVVIRKCS